MSRSIVRSLGLIVLVGWGPAQVACAAEPAELTALNGLWRTERHGAWVQVADCGNGTPCGRLAWVDGQVAAGQTHDVRNRDPALRHRPLQGLPILWGFVAQPDGWRQGRVYNPDDGKTFAARLRLLRPDVLQVTGCLGPLCRSETWARVVPPSDAASSGRDGATR